MDAAPFFNTVRPARIAGGLLLASALVAYWFHGAVLAVPLVLGLALVVTQDPSKLDIFRIFVFVWAGASVLLSIPLAFEGHWAGALKSLLLSGAVAGLMLENLREPTIAVLALIGFGAVLW